MSPAAHRAVVAPATWPRPEPAADRLLVVDGDRLEHATFGDLPRLLAPGDLVVVNDAATLPASLHGTARGERVELRLAAGDLARGEVTAVLFGAGDFRTRTEDRPPPPPLERGDALAFDGLAAEIASVDPAEPRLVRVRFDRRGAALLGAVYRAGRPVQYAHVAEPLPLWHAQTPFAARPWAFELPSAGRPLTAAILRELGLRGVAVESVTHAAGLSSTGEPRLDARLPLPERFDVPERTVRAVARARARGGAVVAIGTSVVRALEGAAAATGELRAGAGETDWLGSASTELSVCDGIVTGVHAPGESHFELLQAFAPHAALERARDEAARAGYLAHEFGDAMWIRASDREPLSAGRSTRPRRGARR